MQPNPAESFDDLAVADFDGDGRADVATLRQLEDDNWWISSGGTAPLTLLHASAPVPLSRVAAIGRFDTRAGADVLLWRENHLDIAPRGSANIRRHSFVDVNMR